MHACIQVGGTAVCTEEHAGKRQCIPHSEWCGASIAGKIACGITA